MDKRTIRTRTKEIESMRPINLMLALENLNDQIPMNTEFEINGKFTQCLKGFINDAIIGFSSNYQSYERSVELKNIYEALTSETMELIGIEDTALKQLETVLNELIKAIPMNECFAINNHEGQCFNQYVQTALNNLTNEFHNPNTKTQIANIYQVMELNNHTQFKNKY